MAKLVSKVYGDALFSLAVENDNLNAIWDEAKALKQVVESNQELNAIMAHPSMTGEQKLRFTQDIFQDRLSETMQGFMHVLVKKGRFSDLVDVLDYFESQAKEYNHIGVAFVTTAIPLTDEKKDKIEKRLLEVSEYESFEMNYAVDRNLIGGMVIRIGDRVMDDSIRHKLDGMVGDLMKVRLG